jgi:hypothetical protein
MASRELSRLSDLVASSSASKRNFSTFGFIHSKVRNCLKEDVVQELVYIKTNSMQFTKQTEIAGELNYISDDESINSDLLRVNTNQFRWNLRL